MNEFPSLLNVYEKEEKICGIAWKFFAIVDEMTKLDKRQSHEMSDDSMIEM